jgi:hypothetical protein
MFFTVVSLSKGEVLYSPGVTVKFSRVQDLSRLADTNLFHSDRLLALALGALLLLSNSPVGAHRVLLAAGASQRRDIHSPSHARTRMSSTQVDSSDPRWQLTERVLNAPLFEKSPRLRSFLRFVCQMELTGRRVEINEQTIGVHVFGRQPAYSPGEDSIVRSQARFLRQRLDEYFRTDGIHEPLRITIPKGSYVPVFEPNESQPPHPVELANPVVVSTEPKLQRWRIPIVVGASLLLASVALLYLRGAPHSQTNTEQFWNTVFSPKRRVIIVPADSTLILIEELTNEKVALNTYLSRNYLSDRKLPTDVTGLSATDLNNSHYTSMADLNLVARLVRVPKRSQIEIRYARDLSITDSKEDNLILIGGARANPWVELFASHMNFYVDFDWNSHRNSVINKNPQKGEEPLYVENPSGSLTHVYGLIVFQPSLDREGDALLVAGTSSAGTQTAADFLLSESLFGEFLTKIHRSDGTIPHFELLLEASSMNGNVPQSTIVAYRVNQ